MTDTTRKWRKSSARETRLTQLIEKLMHVRNWSASDVEAAGDIAKGTFFAIRYGITEKPSVDILMALARAFDVPLMAFFEALGWNEGEAHTLETLNRVLDRQLAIQEQLNSMTGLFPYED